MAPNIAIFMNFFQPEGSLIMESFSLTKFKKKQHKHLYWLQHVSLQLNVLNNNFEGKIERKRIHEYQFNVEYVIFKCKWNSWNLYCSDYAAGFSEII